MRTSKPFDAKRLVGLAVLLLFVVAVVYFWSDIMALVGSREAVERTVESWGVYGPLVFVLINFAQVILAPIPGQAVGVAGGYLFGFWLGFLLNVAGILLGSLAAFGLARAFGKPLVDRFVGPHTRDFLERAASKNGVRGLFVLYLLPFLPDDALCLMAGLTPIRWSTFALVVVLGRSPGSLVASLTGAGLVDLPLWAWAVVAVGAIGAAVFWWFKGDAIEERMRALVSRRLSRAHPDDTEDG